MPIYEYQCSSCDKVFERLELKVTDIPTSQCPFCSGVGVKVISAPSLVYELFDETAIHKLPDFHQKSREAELHDRRVRQNLRLPPLEHDMGQGIKSYSMEFGKSERSKLENKAQLDNM